MEEQAFRMLDETAWQSSNQKKKVLLKAHENCLFDGRTEILINESDKMTDKTVLVYYKLHGNIISYLFLYIKGKLLHCDKQRTQIQIIINI
jgi:hypothetical protein